MRQPQIVCGANCHVIVHVSLVHNSPTDTCRLDPAVHPTHVLPKAIAGRKTLFAPRTLVSLLDVYPLVLLPLWSKHHHITLCALSHVQVSCPVIRVEIGWHLRGADGAHVSLLPSFHVRESRTPSKRPRGKPLRGHRRRPCPRPCR